MKKNLKKERKKERKLEKNESQRREKSSCFFLILKILKIIKTKYAKRK